MRKIVLFVVLGFAVTLALAHIKAPEPQVNAPKQKEAERSQREMDELRGTMLHLRKELRGRNILQTVRTQLPKADIDSVKKQFNIRLDKKLQNMGDEEIYKMIVDIQKRMRRVPAYDYPNEFMKEIYLKPPKTGNSPWVDDEAVLKVSRSVVAIVDRHFLTKSPGENQWKLTVHKLGDMRTGYGAYCGTENLRNADATQVLGTGFLVATDTIATAGHVASMNNFVDSVYFLFDYVMEITPDGDAVKTVFDENEVYAGDRVLECRTGDADWALIHLERAVRGEERTPLKYRSHGQVAGDVYMIGYPDGMSQKYVGVAPVTFNGWCALFLAPLDSRSGNSGSPVFSAVSNLVEGILVKAVPCDERICNCLIASQSTQTYGRTGSEVVRTTEFAGFIGHPDRVLVRCGDFSAPVALISAKGQSFALPSRGEQFLPYDRLGFLLAVNDTCDVAYFPEGGSVWDVLEIDSTGALKMEKACSP
jgi:V8-like Glu-specific endopeptidase